MVLVGCSVTPPPVEQPVESSDRAYLVIDADAGLERIGQGEDRLVTSRFEAGAVEQRLQYRLDYSLRSGVLARSVAENGDRSTAAPSELGRQTVNQVLEVSLPASFGSPISLDLHNRQELRWGFNGEVRSDTTRAHLNWSPSLFQLDLAWAPPRETIQVSQPLDCGLEANLRLAALPLIDDSALDLTRRVCQVLAPARGVGQVQLESEGVAWRWGAREGQVLSIDRVRPYATLTGHVPFEPAYRFSLAHQQSLADWRLGMDLAWHRFDRSQVIDSAMVPSRWSFDLELQRDLGWLGLRARWLHAHDPLWFLPLASPVERERVSLGVDLSRWLLESLPGTQGRLSASLDHVEDARGDDYQQVQWSLELTW